MGCALGKEDDWERGDGLCGIGGLDSDAHLPTEPVEEAELQVFPETELVQTVGNRQVRIGFHSGRGSTGGEELGCSTWKGAWSSCSSVIRMR